MRGANLVCQVAGTLDDFNFLAVVISGVNAALDESTFNDKQGRLQHLTTNPWIARSIPRFSGLLGETLNRCPVFMTSWLVGG